LITLTAKAFKRIISGILIPEIIKGLMTAKEFKLPISLWKEFYDPMSRRTVKSTLGPQPFPKWDCLVLSPHMPLQTCVRPHCSSPSTLPSPPSIHYNPQSGSLIHRPPMNQSTIRMLCTPSCSFVCRSFPLASRLTRILPQVIPGLFPRGLSHL
jgi:hypothetical protein